VTSLPGSAASHALDEDVEMLLADPSSSTHFTIPHPYQPTAESSSLPPTGVLATSLSPFDIGAPQPAYPSLMDDDARSVASLPPLYDASDSEFEEGHLNHGVYDFMSDSEADAHDVEMILLVDNEDLSDHEGVVLPQSTPSAATEDSRDPRHVTLEEIEDHEDQVQQQTGECNGFVICCDAMNTNMTFRYHTLGGQ
jgi:hypothetical protein